MRFGDALCAAMHDGKWISSVVVTDQRLAKAGIRTVRERVAFCFNVKTSLWDAAVWYPGKAWHRWQTGSEVIPCRMSAEAIAAEWEIVEVPE